MSDGPPSDASRIVCVSSSWSEGIAMNAPGDRQYHKAPSNWPKDLCVYDYECERYPSCDCIVLFGRPLGMN